MSSESGQCMISVFMPVYNGSYYLTDSINSVLRQTFKDFELVCVDDSSTDNSYEILNNFENTDSRIKIFRKPNGGNTAKSWNFIMPYLKGNSITYMSQDDLMSEDNLDRLYKRQVETGADCVLPDMVYFYENEKNNVRLSGVKGNRDIILTNREAVILSLNWEIHGFALWRSTLVKNEYFPEDSFANDEYITRKLLMKSNKVAFCDGIFYYRQDNKMAITKTYDIKNYNIILTDFRVYKLLEENNFEPGIIASVLYKLYVVYFNQYRDSLLRKAIDSDDEFKKIRDMHFGLYSRFNSNRFYELAKYLSGFKRLKIYIFWALFYNYSIFKIIMFLIFINDRSIEKIKKLKLLPFYLFPN